MVDLVVLAPPAIADLSLLAQSSSGSFWLPPPESVSSWAVDGIFNFLMYLSYFFFALILGLMVTFVIRYRRRPGVEPIPTPSHSIVLEAVWSLIPLGLVIVIFYFGFVGYVELRSPPERAYDIKVLARKWSWQFIYPDGTIDPDLHVPVGEPVRLTMISEDVIHSLSIPAFRVKMDIVPGRYTRTWFQARQPGQFDLYCTEYCGTGHSDMLATVVVHDPEDFDQWLVEAGDIFGNDATPAEAGQKLFRRNGCGSCHSTDGTAKIGPTLKGVYGKTHKFTDGSSAEVDENYIRQSLFEPGAKLREGFSNKMPMQAALVGKEQEIAALIAYIESLE
jgi:cytochrome c oxidase subunit II